MVCGQLKMLLHCIMRHSAGRPPQGCHHYGHCGWCKRAFMRGARIWLVHAGFFKGGRQGPEQPPPVARRRDFRFIGTRPCFDGGFGFVSLEKHCAGLWKCVSPPGACAPSADLSNAAAGLAASDGCALKMTTGLSNLTCAHCSAHFVGH